MDYSTQLLEIVRSLKYAAHSTQSPWTPTLYKASTRLNFISRAPVRGPNQGVASPQLATSMVTATSKSLHPCPPTPREALNCAANPINANPASSQASIPVSTQAAASTIDKPKARQVGPFQLEAIAQPPPLDLNAVQNWFDKNTQGLRSSVTHSNWQRKKTVRLTPVAIVYEKGSPLSQPLQSLSLAIEKHFTSCSCYVDEPNLREQISQGLSSQRLQLVITESSLKSDLLDPQKPHIIVIGADDLSIASLKIRLWRRIEAILKSF